MAGEAANGERAVELARELRPDVVLMDVQMPLLDGVSATRLIATEGLADVLVLTTFDLDEYAFSGLKAGAVASVASTRCCRCSPNVTTTIFHGLPAGVNGDPAKTMPEKVPRPNTG